MVLEPVTPEPRWWELWDDGQSREHAGLLEDAEMQRREDDYR